MNQRYTSHSVTRRHPYLTSATPDNFIRIKNQKHNQMKLKQSEGEREKRTELSNRPVTGVSTYYDALSCRNTTSSRAMARAKKMLKNQDLGFTKPDSAWGKGLHTVLKQLLKFGFQEMIM